MMLSRKISFKNIAFGLIICCLFFIALEMIFRVFLSIIITEKNTPKLYSDFFPQHEMYIEDEYLFWKGKPNWKGLRGQIEVNLNSFGLRDVEFPMRKGPSTYRILSLGESGTFGDGIILGDSYNKQLEAMLKKYYGDSKLRFQVINAGQCSYTSFQGLLYLKKYGLNFKPDLVMTYFENNDDLPSYFVLGSKKISFQDLFDYRRVGPGITDRQLFLKRQRLFSIAKALNKSAFYRGLSGLILHAKAFFDIRVDKNNVREGENLKIWENRKRVTDEERKWVFSQFVSIVNKRQIKLLILIPPYVPYVYKDDKYNPFSFIVTSRDVQILDLGKVFRDSQYNHDELFSDDVHPTVLGHRLIAEAIFNKLAEINRDTIAVAKRYK